MRVGAPGSIPRPQVLAKLHDGVCEVALRGEGRSNGKMKMRLLIFRHEGRRGAILSDGEVIFLLIQVEIAYPLMHRRSELFVGGTTKDLLVLREGPVRISLDALSHS